MRKLFPMHVLLLGLALAFPAAAQESAGDVETIPVDTGEDEPDSDLPSATYGTVGLAMITPDFDNVKSAVNIEGTLIGLRIPTAPWFGVELNGSFTMIPGQVDDPGCGGPFGGACPDNVIESSGDFAAHMFGVYGVLRSPGTVFAMGKIGYRYLISVEEFEDDRSGTAWAVGGGYRWSRDGFVELGYRKINDRLDGIGLTFSRSYGD